MGVQSFGPGAFNFLRLVGGGGTVGLGPLESELPSPSLAKKGRSHVHPQFSLRAESASL